MQTTGWRDGLGTHVGVSMITGQPPTSKWLDQMVFMF